MATERLADAGSLAIWLYKSDSCCEVTCCNHESLRLSLEDCQAGDGWRRLSLLLVLLLCLQHAVEVVRLVSYHDLSVHVA